MIKNITKLFVVTLTFAIALGNLNAKTIKASKAFEKNLIKNAIVAPTANNILFTSEASKVQYNYDKPIRYTKSDKTGFERIEKKSFSEDILGTTAIDPSKMPGVYWGSTYYDLQTNASMAERSKLFTTGGRSYIQTMWMCEVTQNTGWPNRGTFYESIDVTDPTGIYTESLFESPIEKLNGNKVRTGWPSIVQFPNGSVGTTSHDSTAPNSFRSIIWSKNNEFEDNVFKSNLCSNSNPLWARTAIDGAGVLHTIYTWTNNTNTLDKYGEIGYRRSTDGGATWSNEIMMTGPNAFDGEQNSGVGADVYAIDAKDNKIVIAYTDDFYNLNYRKSEDNGVTWSTPTIVFSSGHNKYYNTGDLGGGKSSIVTDTVYSSGTMIDVVLDKNNVAHFVTPVFSTYLKGEGVLNNGELVSWDTVNTWSTGTLLYRSFLYTYENNKTGIELIASAVGDTTEGQLATNRYRVGAGFGHSLGFYPQLGVDDNNNLYLTFSGLVRDDYKEVTIKGSDGNLTTFEGFYGHIYATWKSQTQPGTSWAESKLITYTTGADAIFPSMCNTVKTINGRNWMFINYSANPTPGSFVSYTDLPTEEEFLFMVPYPADSLNTLRITDVKENTKTDGNLYINVVPNPASEIANIKINASENDIISNLVIYDMFGNKVLSINDNKINTNLPVNLKNFASGVYSVNMMINGNSVTKLFTVIK
jgi:hypothetical protein